MDVAPWSYNLDWIGIHWMGISEWGEVKSTLQCQKDIVISSLYCALHKAVFLIPITSDLKEPSVPKPPVSLSLPPTIEDFAPYRDRGREARVVQAGAPGGRLSTEGRRPDPSSPPATMSACTDLNCKTSSQHSLRWARI